MRFDVLINEVLEKLQTEENEMLAIRVLSKVDKK